MSSFESYQQLELPSGPMPHETRLLLVDNHQWDDARTRDRRVQGFVDAVASYNARQGPAGRCVSIEVIPFHLLGSTEIHHDGAILSGSGISIAAIKADAALARMFQAEVDLIRSVQIPLLGVCFGHQLIAHAFGFPVGACKVPEGGIMDICFAPGFDLVPEGTITLENHHQREVVPSPATLFDATFTVHASTDACHVQAMRHRFLPLFGVQFHPESRNSRAMPGGQSLIHGFLDLVAFKAPVLAGRARAGTVA